ncbi:MAG: hypothetical protein ABI165_16045, partial [Bryobacteraceae bacterium]
MANLDDGAFGTDFRQGFGRVVDYSMDLRADSDDSGFGDEWRIVGGGFRSRKQSTAEATRGGQRLEAATDAEPLAWRLGALRADGNAETLRPAVVESGHDGSVACLHIQASIFQVIDKSVMLCRNLANRPSVPHAEISAADSRPDGDATDAKFG